jgi:hypothetical protein
MRTLSNNKMLIFALTLLTGMTIATDTVSTDDAANAVTEAVTPESADQILSGTATVSISGSTSGGKSFSYSGTLTFNGSQTATPVFGNGNSYSISWS